MERAETVFKLRRRLALCALFYAVILVFLAGLFAFNGNYTRIYHSPEVKAGRADFSGVDLEGRRVACVLAGEWEFYYDKWIVTDGETDGPDGLLRLPGRWTGKEFGQGALPADGYASFRIVLENVAAGVEINVFRVNFAGAYRIFLNGKMITASGTMSKDAAKTGITGKLDERHEFVTDGQPLEVVIELSATRRGGMLAAPWLTQVSSASISRFATSLRNYSAAALGVSAAAVAYVLLSALFFRTARNASLAALMLGLFLHFLFSKDMLYFVPVSYGAALIVEAVSAGLSVAALIWHLTCAGMRASWRFHAVIGALTAGMVCLFFVLRGTDYVALAALGLLLALAAYSYPLLASRMPPAERGVYAALYAFLLTVFAFEAADVLGLIVFGTEFIFSVEIMCMLACIAILGLWHIAVASRRARRAGELERELFRVKQQALKAQIKPHFVFNALTAIQSLYRSSLEAGDEGLERFARHLRANIDSDGADLIPFEEEVRNILNYFELENMRAGGALTLLLDINCTDFVVPVLSLQPLVENAIRHGETTKRENGFIALSSSRSGNAVKIEVSDNGKGFDRENVQEGVGLENTRRRFESMLNADMVVASAVGKGTKITITIREDV